MKITDLKPYRPHIDEFDLTEEEKLELVNAIVEIAEVVLDRKFDNIHYSGAIEAANTDNNNV